MSKYNPLWEYIQKSKRDNLILSYDKIKDILGFSIYHSFLTYKKEAKEYGYEVRKNINERKNYYFNKINNYSQKEVRNDSY